MVNVPTGISCATALVLVCGILNCNPALFGYILSPATAGYNTEILEFTKNVPLLRNNQIYPVICQTPFVKAIVALVVSAVFVTGLVVAVNVSKQYPIGHKPCKVAEPIPFV